MKTVWFIHANLDTTIETVFFIVLRPRTNGLLMMFVLFCVIQ